MYGAIIGDIVGSRFEFDRGNKTKEFELFSPDCEFTDDTVMTCAVAEALLDSGLDADEKTVKDNLISSMKKWGKRYPGAGYGARFTGWVLSDDPKPYNSWGNGSGMRVSAAGWLYPSMERTREVARWTAEVTHNHPEGIKGAESVAAAIFMARNGAKMDEIREYIVSEFEYDLTRTVDEIRPTYHHVEDCMHTIPEAFECFLESTSYEDCLRNAISIGGDTDTLGAIAGAMAEAYWGIPLDILTGGLGYLTEDISQIADRFKGQISNRPQDLYQANLPVKICAEHYFESGDPEDAIMLISFLQKRIADNGQAPMPMVDVNNALASLDMNELVMGKEMKLEQEVRLRFDTMRDPQGNEYYPLFTDTEELGKGETANIVINTPIRKILMDGLNNDKINGVVINPFGKNFILGKELIKMLFDKMEGRG